MLESPSSLQALSVKIFARYYIATAPVRLLVSGMGDAFLEERCKSYHGEIVAFGNRVGVGRSLLQLNMLRRITIQDGRTKIDFARRGKAEGRIEHYDSGIFTSLSDKSFEQVGG
jgi:hypothetical protein